MHYRTQNSRQRSPAFTLVELLAVIFIIALLITLILGAVHRAQRASRIAKTRADLSAISTALEQYHSDFKVYPGLPNPPPGTPFDHTILAKALVGPGPATEDGADGSGFRTVINPATGTFDPNSKKWDAYLSPEHLNIQRFNPLPGKPVGYWAFVDYFGNTIRYYPRRRNFALNLGPLVGNATKPGIFDIEDGEDPDPSKNVVLDAITLAFILGDTNRGNTIDNDESLKTDSNFILVTAGPDNIFNLLTGDPQLKKSDDIFNFDR
ncbi:MAG TPA: prepilin-type N-terminal cleavage/methylation domain-containing protein [Tepidisphaeraceae bacterium]|jgi:type II secretory pathway pseudopilin PulG|nr:prepilin-type N-terminal cleavage/methylation domain-containing protein [Tepidisphaeraceae bacterium]